ncbi:MAG: hypothetical protein IPO40_16715 [Fibrobacteres bacterium]|nr:hypothetical protein [Fibrobacterota bacterium]
MNVNILIWIINALFGGKWACDDRSFACEQVRLGALSPKGHVQRIDHSKLNDASFIDSIGENSLLSIALGKSSMQRLLDSIKTPLRSNVEVAGAINLLEAAGKQRELDSLIFSFLPVGAFWAFEAPIGRYCSYPTHWFARNFPSRWIIIQTEFLAGGVGGRCRSTRGSDARVCKAMLEIRDSVKQAWPRVVDLEQGIYCSDAGSELDLLIRKKIQLKILPKPNNSLIESISACREMPDQSTCGPITKFTDSLLKTGIYEISELPYLEMRFAANPNGYIDSFALFNLEVSEKNGCYDWGSFEGHLARIAILAKTKKFNIYSLYAKANPCLSVGYDKERINALLVHWLGGRMNQKLNRLRSMPLKDQQRCMDGLVNSRCELIQDFHRHLQKTVGTELVWPLPYLVDRKDLRQ